MSKINQIEKALQEIDATKFHKLLDAYLTKKTSYTIHSNGTKTGEDKPKKGTPDSYIILEDGKYIFIEYTTQKTNIVKKFLKDLEKCFDEEKTGVKIVQINKIILVCNSDLNIQEIKQFIDYCSSKNVVCEFFENSYLANDLFSNYPNIAKEFLDISIDTGQILDCEEFIDAYEKNKFSTSLNTELQFRDMEIQKLKESLINNQITFITGVAGVGKTKLAIDIGSLYAKENGLNFKTIMNRGVNIFDDLKVYFNSQYEQYLIFIDDVNRIHLSLEYLFEYYGEKINQGTIKIIATIRDYAKEKLFDKLPKSISYYELELKPLSDNSIKKIVEKEYLITNHLYLNRIADISKGNPRLALMAASIVKKQDRLDTIYDMTTLYDEYFSSIEEDIAIFEKDDLVLLSIAIISFFRIIDRENTQQIDMIEKAFDVSIDTIWKNIEELHRLEVVDMYENNVVKVSDQILSIYLFYKIVFIDKKIKMDIFLKHFFPSFKGKFVDALNPLLSSFDTNLILEVLRGPVNTLWVESLSNKQHLYEVIKTFWFLKQTDILIYFSEEIEQLNNAETDTDSLDIWKQMNTNQTDEILSNLSLFRHDSLENIKISIELIIKYLTKMPSKIYEVIIVLTKNFGFKYDSYRYNYSKEKLLIDTLWELLEEGKNQLLTRLFIRVCSEFLKTEFEENEMKRHSFIISRYKLYETEYLEELRNGIFEKLDILFSYEFFLEDLECLIQKYPSGISCSIGISNVEKWDVQNILNLIEKYFNSSIYRHCQIVQNLLKSFDGHKLIYDNSVKEAFKHEAYELKNYLFLNDVDISLEQPRNKEEKTDWDKIRQIKHEMLADFVKDYTLNDWLQLFDLCKLFFADQGRDTYNLKSNLNELFQIVAHKNETLYVDVLEKYLELGDPFLLNLNMSDLIKILGKEKAFDFINKYLFHSQEVWLFNLLIAIDESKITPEDIQTLLKLYNSANFKNMPYHLNYLIKYCNVDENIFLEIMTVLVSRVENEDISFVSSSIIFNHFTEIFKIFDKYMYSDLILFKKAYLFCLNYENHFDHDMIEFNKLLNFDINFVDDYIINILNSNNKLISSHDIGNDFSLIWKRDDYEKIFLKIIELIYSLKTKQLVWRKGELLKAFFINRENQDEIENRVDTLIQNYINLYFSDNERIIFIFELISEFSEERRIALISYFIARNNSFELFKQLSLEPMIRIWNGSRIPSLQKEINFYTSLLSLMTTSTLLRHKQKVEQHINYLKQDMQRERKSDFMKDEFYN